LFSLQFSCGEYKEEETVEVAAEQYRKEALQEFKEKTHNFDKTFVQTFTETLLDLIQQSLNRFKQTNWHRKVRRYVQALPINLVSVQNTGKRKHSTHSGIKNWMIRFLGKLSLPIFKVKE